MFAPGNIVVRLPWSLLLGLMMWYVLGWSVRQTSPNFYTQSVTELGINMLTGVTVLQVPLWIAKRAFRYRMIAPGEDPLPTAAERMQFQISHMLIGTLIFAIALSPLRAVLPKEGLEHFRLDWRMFVLVGVAIVAQSSGHSTMPVGRVCSNVKVVPLGIAWLLYCLVVTGLEFAAALRGLELSAEPVGGLLAGLPGQRLPRRRGVRRHALLSRVGLPPAASSPHAAAAASRANRGDRDRGDASDQRRFRFNPIRLAGW